jgi:hypothetical protein
MSEVRGITPSELVEKLPYGTNKVTQADAGKHPIGYLALATLDPDISGTLPVFFDTTNTQAQVPLALRGKGWK